ncbi:hypothetical protein DRH14_04185 [Candidatus Shapirobacteria bacterium]|nr:MAG: hypothetical protein DRH14_04185 [Candidatus Shapirobacteria bacterium]
MHKPKLKLKLKKKKDTIPNLNPKVKTPKKEKKPISAKKAKIKKIFLITLAIVSATTLTITIFLFFFAFLPSKKLYATINQLKSKKDYYQQVLASKDLAKIKTEIDNLKGEFQNISHQYNQMSIFNSIPFINQYYKDGKQSIKIAKQSLDTSKIVIEAIEPYQDFLGLKGESTNSAKTTEDRINFLTDSIESIVPKLDQIEKNMAEISQSLNQIDPNRYPDQYKGINIKSNLVKAQQTISEIHRLVKEGKPILTKTSWLLGKDSPRKYFLLFQNDAELRPSGGFWTAYGILKVDNGKITPVISSDIYSLDAKLQSTIPAPRPIKAYHINVPYWNIRDMNISPDFPTDAKLFLEHYSKVSKEKFDAIIALDTQVLVDFVKVLGRVGVPGWGNFTPEPDKRCDGCPQIIYQLEYIAGKPRNYIETNRKGFLGPLMHSLLANAMGSPKEKIAPLATAMLNDIHQKHILFYFLDEEIQQAAESANIAGKIEQKLDSNTDYIHLNDANMASAKTNIFIKQKIKHEITTKKGTVEHKISITYNNPTKASNCNLEKGDLCLNAPKYRNWFRLYTPQGSKLIKMTGSEVEPVIYEELDKQVFEGFYGDRYPLYAQSSSIVTIQYTTPIKASSDYKLYLQKQAGTKAVAYQITVNGKRMDKFDWLTDKVIKLPL